MDVHDDGAIVVDGRRFHDNVARVPGSDFADDPYGDRLPNVPTVLTGLCVLENGETWPALSWSVQDLAARSCPTTKVSLDGGPSFARASICSGKVSMTEYQRYCEADADGDSTPLYVFDADFLKSTFSDGSLVSSASSIPACFSNDMMSCCNGTRFRPLPPAWLLVGVVGSGTPIHDHPLTVAWNALLTGLKLWCCLPPDVDESLLLLNLHDNNEEEDDDEEFDFDVSARQWFGRCCQEQLVEHSGAKIIVQRPGEVLFVPAGWFHVVLNVETSTAISMSLTLARDLPAALALLQSDHDFATFWLDRLDPMVKNDMNLDETDQSFIKPLLEHFHT